MSRIGKLPIPILDKATVTIDGQSVSYKVLRSNLKSHSTTPLLSSRLKTR